ncbi:MAG: hypothetical protein ACRECY_17685, partial [Phyllobacterium sp.]
PDDGLLGRLDEALASAHLQQDQSGRDVLDALVGLRRALFPYARPPFTPRNDDETIKPSISGMLIAAE